MINADTNVVDFLAPHGIDAPVFTPDVSTVSYDLPQPAMDESIPNDNDTLNPDAEPSNEPGDDVNEVDDVIMESEDSENDDYEEGSEDLSDDIDYSDACLGRSDDDVVPIERKHHGRFNVDDQRPSFSLGMTFSNAAEVRESITWYAISMGVALKQWRSYIGLRGGQMPPLKIRKKLFTKGIDPLPSLKIRKNCLQRGLNA